MVNSWLAGHSGWCSANPERVMFHRLQKRSCTRKKRIWMLLCVPSFSIWSFHSVPSLVGSVMKCFFFLQRWKLKDRGIIQLTQSTPCRRQNWEEECYRYSHSTDDEALKLHQHRSKNISNLSCVWASTNSMWKAKHIKNTCVRLKYRRGSLAYPGREQCTHASSRVARIEQVGEPNLLICQLSTRYVQK